MAKKRIVKEEEKAKPLANIYLFISLIITIFYFIVNMVFKTITNFSGIINPVLLTLFSIVFTAIALTSQRKNKASFILGSTILIIYFLINSLNILDIVKITSITRVENFTGRSLSEVAKWAELNNVDIKQEYEYSDMVSEYNIISQNVKAGTKVNEIKDITVAVSEGPNPSKEILIPSMIGWDSERVIDFVNKNYLSNVSVEYISSEDKEDTVIEQDKTGTIKRNDEIILKFSEGENTNFNEIKLIDLKKKTKFESLIYLKKNHINYKYEEEFSKIKKNLVSNQSMKPASIININEDELTVYISKGQKIIVPDISKMNMTSITEWIVKNRLKIEYIEKYDDSIEKNKIIEIDKQKDDILAQGDIVKVTISKGSLTMPEFKDLNTFREWANKYDVKYTEEHAFSDTVKIGDVIKYSYKPGEAIKNNDTIIITISDGKKIEMPNLINLTKKEAIEKLKNIGINYNFLYQSSDKEKDKVIDQSITKGSKISKTTTVSIVLSNGKGKNENENNDEEVNYRKEEKQETEKTTIKNKSTNQTTTNNKTNNNTTKEEKPKTQTKNCQEKTIYIAPDFISSTPSSTCAAIKNYYSDFTFTCSYKSSMLASGMLINSSTIDGNTFSTCETINLVISSN